MQAKADQLPLTQDGLSKLLSELGCPVSPRRLTDWVRKGLLPPMERSRRPKGTGRGAFYCWNDRRVLLQAVTLWACLRERHRTDSAMLSTWFLGLSYPLDRMKPLWLTWQRERISRTRAFLLGGKDAPIPSSTIARYAAAEEARTRTGRRVEPVLIAFSRARWEPDYDPSTVLSERDGLAVTAVLLSILPSGSALAPAITNGNIRTVLGLYHRHFAGGLIPDIVESIPDDTLRDARRDLELVMAPVLAILQQALDRYRRTGQKVPAILIWLLPRISGLIGEGLLLLDFALRSSGLGDTLDQTRTAVESSWLRPGVAEGVESFRRDPDVEIAFQEMFLPPRKVSRTGTGEAPQLISLWESRNDLAHARAAASGTWSAISALWKPQVETLVKALESLDSLDRKSRRPANAKAGY
jgi:hypothetical protein